MILKKYDEALVEQIAGHYKKILELIGEDPEREGLLKTPVRAAKALLDITRGYDENAVEIVKSAVFNHEGSNIVIVKDIEFYSLCEHHILPFFGKVSVGYIPNGKMVGLSKLARIVDTYAHRLQVQERLTGEVCRTLQEALLPKGAIVVCEAGHMCMKMRGVEKQESITTTMEYCGAFEDVSLRQEFMQLLHSK